MSATIDHGRVILVTPVGRIYQVLPRQMRQEDVYVCTDAFLGTHAGQHVRKA